MKTMNNTKCWTEYLPQAVYDRLCNCRTLKSDIETLVDVKWAYMYKIGKREKGFTKEDALVAILELLDSNGQSFNLTPEEYNELKNEYGN